MYKKINKLLKTLLKRFYCYIQKEEETLFLLWMIISCIAGIVFFVLVYSLFVISRYKF